MRTRARKPVDARTVAVAATVLPLFAAFAWTLLWSLTHGGNVFAVLAQPWAAPKAALSWPVGVPLDGSLKLTGFVAAGVTMGLAAAIFAPRLQAIFGDARFAKGAELARAGLLAPSGLLLGRAEGPISRFLRHDGPLHLLVAAPTRSGKGVGVVTPNLLSWPGSVVVLDIKDENFRATSGFRAANGQRVFRFAPGDPAARTARYNPLAAVRRDPRHRIADLQSIAHLLAPHAGGEAAMWAQEARSLFVGLCLYVLDTPDIPLTFGQIARILQTNQPFADALGDLLAARGDLDPACVNMLANFIGKAAKEQSGVRSTLTGALELWNDPIIDAATSASDFDLGELRRVPTTIYVSVALDQLDRCAFLLAILFQQLVGIATRELPSADEPHRLLVLIDEFASLGRMDVVVDKMPFLAGFNVRLMLIVQGLAQLDRLYGASGRELVLQNAGLQLFFASNDDQTSAYVSQRLGTYTDAQPTRSRSTPMLGGGHGNITRSQSLHARPLLSINEVRRVDPRSQILFVEGGRPVRGRKIAYYADPVFTCRLLPPVPVEAIAVVRHPPFRFIAADPAPSLPTPLGGPRPLTDAELAELDGLRDPLPARG